jgi:hypothetical protein
LRRNSEKMRPVLPPDTMLPHQLQVRLVDQGGTLQCVVRAFAAQMPAGQAMKLSVHQGRKLLERLLIAPAPLLQ